MVTAAEEEKKTRGELEEIRWADRRMVLKQEEEEDEAGSKWQRQLAVEEPPQAPGHGQSLEQRQQKHGRKE